MTKFGHKVPQRPVLYNGVGDVAVSAKGSYGNRSLAGDMPVDRKEYLGQAGKRPR